ncbi:FEKKY domain-containing protein [Psychroserpens mesophilus]|uniref:FEKKY domain-containing protein n=1 Tax=Psychroserpens mesophilus TaxID=325473 RepID=UPI00058CBC87|nr:hypothetical protein [Psychroserpens mesophilus]
MNRKRIIFIGILLIGIGILLWNFGFFSSYNYLTAKADIANGKLQKIAVGEQLLMPKEIDEISRKYGFTNIAFGCIVSQPEINGIDIYNEQMDKHLTELNDDNWKAKYRKEIDSLINLKVYSEIPDSAFWIEKNGIGNWFNVDWMHNHKNNAIISIYDKSGELIIKSKFMKICPIDELKFIEDLKSEIDFYDGENIQLKDNCYLLKK